LGTKLIKNDLRKDNGSAARIDVCQLEMGEEPKQGKKDEKSGSSKKKMAIHLTVSREAKGIQRALRKRKRHEGGRFRDWPLLDRHQWRKDGTW